jgi:hypothetical protein
MHVPLTSAQGWPSAPIWLSAAPIHNTVSTPRQRGHLVTEPAAIANRHNRLTLDFIAFGPSNGRITAMQLPVMPQ